MPRVSYLAAVLLAGTAFASVALTQQPTDSGATEQPAGKADVVLKRRIEATDEDLRKQLQFVRELGLDQDGAAALYAPIKAAGAKVTSLPPDLGPKFFGQMMAQRNAPEQLALPWRAGPDCEMGKEAAERLHVLSLKLRDYLRQSVPKGDIRPDPEKLRALLASDGTIEGVRPRTKKSAGDRAVGGKAAEWATPQALPTLMQMLQAENTPVRELLIELLGNIKGKEASLALAQRALFDLSATVREKAVLELAKRPAQEYQQALVFGLRYPWTAAADHAAEAIAALQLSDLVGDMVSLLKEPDPTYPQKNEKVYVVKELVRVNHMSNCMLCHAPSLAKNDLIRGRVPMPGEELPPLYYAAAKGQFVRADITFLRQDFSVMQPVPNAGKWPGNQRYDYMLRFRQVTKAELKAFQQLEKDKKLPKSYQQREAVLFALRQVTKMDAGDSYEDWARDLPKLLKAVKEEKK